MKPTCSLLSRSSSRRLRATSDSIWDEKTLIAVWWLVSTLSSYFFVDEAGVFAEDCLSAIFLGGRADSESEESIITGFFFFLPFSCIFMRFY